MVPVAQLVALVLGALVVGALVPALIQHWRTMRRLERLIDETGPRLHRTLDTVDEAAGRIDQIGRGVEERFKGVGSIVDALAGSTRSVDGLAVALRSVTALGAATVAALRAFFSPSDPQLRDGSGRTAGKIGRPPVDGAFGPAHPTGETRKEVHVR